MAKQSKKNEKSVDASKDYLERRRGSMVEVRTDANNELVNYLRKEINVRTPRLGRRKSILVPGNRSKPRNFPIPRLNNYNKSLKKLKGPLSLCSELESIEEDELSDNFDS